MTTSTASPGTQATTTTAQWLTDDHGRRVALWRTGSPQGGDPVVLLTPAFGQDLTRLTPVAQHLAANGAVAYRYDALDHAGLSDGDMRTYSPSTVLRSLELAASAAVAAEGAPTIAHVATSWHARIAIRHAVTSSNVNRLVLLAAVVNGRAALRRALGTDLVAADEPDLPPTVTYRRRVVEPRWIWHDDREHDWTSVAGVAADLDRLQVPVTNVYAADDEWVDRDEMFDVFADRAGCTRSLVEIAGSAHEFGRDPMLLGRVLRLVTAEVLGRDEDDVRAVPLDALLGARASDRALARSMQAIGGSS